MEVACFWNPRDLNTGFHRHNTEVGALSTVPLICNSKHGFLRVFFFSCLYTTQIIVEKIFLHFICLYHLNSVAKRIGRKNIGGAFSNYQLNAQFFYFSTICMLHYASQHVSSSTLLILGRTSCITTASGIVTLCKQRYSMQVKSGLQSTFYLHTVRLSVEWRYQRLWWWNWSSWGWAACCSKHVEDRSVKYTGCPRRNVRDFGRVFLMLNYTNITQNTYIQSWTVMEIMAREVWNFDICYSLIDYQIHIETGRNMWVL